MGQSLASPNSSRQIDTNRCESPATIELSVFLTDFGWFGLLGREEKISRLVIGHTSSDAVRAAMASQVKTNDEQDSLNLRESDWLPEVRRKLENYAAGEAVDFSECQLDAPPRTPFQQRVLELARKIPFGTTVTYGELAKQANASRAARAVGSVMASNRVPIVIPCHRVVAAGAKLGGFSAPNGVRLKEQMLSMEAAVVSSKS